MMTDTGLEDRIKIDPEVCNGKPTIRGLRITVETVLDHLSAGDSEVDILIAFPALERDDIRACLTFAAKLVGHRFTVQHVA